MIKFAFHFTIRVYDNHLEKKQFLKKKKIQAFVNYDFRSVDFDQIDHLDHGIQGILPF